MSSWELRYVADTLDEASEALFDFPLLVASGADFGVIGLQPLEGSAGWFRTRPPADPDRTSIQELDPEGLGWTPVDLRELDIAPSARATVAGHSLTLADDNERSGDGAGAAALREMAAALTA